MKTLYPRTQFEIRYSHILNFKTLFSSIATPYVSLTIEFSITNQNTHEEGYRFNFPNELYSFEFRWDRLIIIIQGDPSFLLNKDSPLKIAQEILEELLKSGSIITNHLIESIGVSLLDDDGIENTQDAFFSTYLSPQAITLLNEVNDVSIQLESNKEDIVESLSFGPYTSKDIEKHKIIPLSLDTEDAVKLRDTERSGFMFRYKYFEFTSKSSVFELKELFKKAKLRNNVFDLLTK